MRAGSQLPQQSEEHGGNGAHCERAAALPQSCPTGRAQVGRSVDVSNSFEILYDMADGKPVFDEAFLEKRLDQCAPLQRDDRARQPDMKDLGQRT